MIPSPIRALLVVDDPSMVVETLNRGLHNVILRTVNGEEQLHALARTQTFDVIITEQQLSGFSGLDVIDLLHGGQGDTPIILLVDTGTEEIAIEALRRGVSEYVINNARHISRLPFAVKSALRRSQELRSSRQAEEALRESEERFRGIFENSMIGLYRTTPEGRVLAANPAMVRMLGYSSFDDLAQLNVEHHGYTSDSLRAEFIRRIEAEGMVVGWEAAWQRIDGRALFVRESARAIRDASNDTLYYEGTVEDITDRKLAEEARLSLERQVQHAQKLESLGVLAGGIAHDFNNILMVILGNAEMASEQLAANDSARKHIQEIDKATKRAAELAGQMLAYSGKGNFVVRTIDLAELIDEISHLIRISISKKIDIQQNLGQQVSAIRGDATQIRQVVMNLITNASEAIGDQSGAIALSIGERECSRAYLDNATKSFSAREDRPLAAGSYVYLEVEDTGCGMAPETLQRIFDPFYTTKFTGRGLGLAAVLGILRGHKGTLEVRSTVGKGTVFRVLFPAAELATMDPPLLGQEEAAVMNWRGIGPILLVDDEPAVRAVAEEMLRHMGLTVLVAEDGREAVRVFKEHMEEIACVLLDLTMPHMDGEEAMREIRGLDPSARVVLCSGYSEQAAVDRFGGAGLAGFIQKPFTMAILREKLGAALRDDDAARGRRA